MKNITAFLLLIVLVTSCATIEKVSLVNFDAPINTESTWAYFELAEKVQQGDTISDIQWEEFINLEGNRLYFSENNMSKSMIALFRKEIELVNHPKNKEVLNSKLESDIRLQIRKRYRDHESAYKKHLRTIEKDQEAYKKSLLTLTKKYLPKRMHQLDTFPQIYVHCLWDGSSGPKGIFVDMIIAHDFDQKRTGAFVSHELHHFMRHSIIDEDNVKENDKGLIWALESTLNEGIADMVDKSILVYEGSDWWLNELYMSLLNYAEDVITEFDLKIQEEAKGTHHSQTKYREVLANSVGHIPGQYMAEKIYEHGRLNDVIEHVDNPFMYFIIYNEIAEANPDILSFSKASIDYIKQLNEVYQ